MMQMMQRIGLNSICYVNLCNMSLYFKYYFQYIYKYSCVYMLCSLNNTDDTHIFILIIRTARTHNFSLSRKVYS